MNFHELFDYRNGLLFWKARPIEHFKNPWVWKAWHTRFANNSAGTINSGGYNIVSIGGKKLKVARIIFEMRHGYAPEQVDHINGDRLDDRIENLRPATTAENSQNAKFGSRNTTGVRCVRPHKSGGWAVRVQRNCQIVYSKVFRPKEFELAELVADEARRHYHGAFFTQRT